MSQDDNLLSLDVSDILELTKISLKKGTNIWNSLEQELLLGIDVEEHEHFEEILIALHTNLNRVLLRTHSVLEILKRRFQYFVDEPSDTTEEGEDESVNNE
jgi:hypothetical protein